MLFLFLAWETLGNPVKRRSYDSVDPQFNDSVPSVNSNSKENFFEVFRPVFAENARYVLTWQSVWLNQNFVEPRENCYDHCSEFQTMNLKRNLDVVLVAGILDRTVEIILKFDSSSSTASPTPQPFAHPTVSVTVLMIVHKIFYLVLFFFTDGQIKRGCLILVKQVLLLKK